MKVSVMFGRCPEDRDLFEILQKEASEAIKPEKKDTNEEPSDGEVHLQTSATR